MRATPEYKCRRCGKVFDGHPEDNPRINIDNLNQWLNNVEKKSAFRIDYDAFTHTHNINLCHRCDDNGIGFGECIGIRLEEL